MGVRGLTTFIAKNANKYLENHQLHDTYLVIDGNNIASQLYKWHCVRNDCFGGDYDKYAKIIYDFFNLLKACNVTPLVVFDGGYEDQKLRTIFSRLRNKVKMARNVNSVTQASTSMFPLFVRELLVDIVFELGLKVVRCDYEADAEMACLARTLNCPVLSYDSDFYIFDVLYIPFSTFDMSLSRIKNTSTPPSYYIQCRLYKIENFMKQYGGISKENLPLIATLLGNDYIKKSVFSNFYSHIKLPKRKHVKSDQQRKIISVIKWMQNETYDSAVKKILSRLKTPQRKRVAEQIQKITQGYACTNSKFLPYLNIDEIAPSDTEVKPNLDIKQILTEVADVEPEDEVEGSDEDSESGDSSDSDENFDPGLFEPQQELVYEGASAWFIEKFRRCEYPASFMNILSRNTYFCTPQIEDYANVCSHHISAPLLAAINKILSSGKAETLTYVARTENARIRNYTTPTCSLELPPLAGLKDLSPEDAKRILLQVLDIDSGEIVRFVSTLPDSWHLYILGIIYWIKNAKPKAAYCHVYSVVLCMFVLNKIDTQIGFYRSTAKFLTKYENKLNSLSKPTQETKSSSDLRQLLNDISHDACLLAMKDLIPYFQMDEKMTTHLKLFDVHILDCFAQLQSCLMHVKYLNILLNKPFDNFLISDFYDGTFLYNMCVNLMKRNDVNAYLSILLKSSHEVFNCFKLVVEMLAKILSGDIVSATKGKRRRKKKKSSPRNEVVAGDECREEESEDGGLVDVNNRFSLLHLVK